MRFLTDKRPIVECYIGGKPANFLLNTGASVGLIDRDFINRYALTAGERYQGKIIGAGGAMNGVRHCDSFVTLPNGVDVAQFLLTDISVVRESIEKETGIEIVGIISWPQILFAGIKLKEE